MSTAPQIAAALHTFDTLSLAELGAAALQDRVDTKFVMAARDVPSLLATLEADYRVLAVSGERIQAYVTDYLDTPDLAFYHAHHNGRAVRHKVRVREYRSTGERYLEVKCRRASGRTSKFRTAAPADGAALSEALAQLSPEAQRIVEGLTLVPSVSTAFDRITLVRRDGGERVTIDLDLTVRRATAHVALGEIAFVEVKQSDRAASPVLTALAERHVRAHAVSKYCVAVALLVPHVKHNRFKPLLARLARIAGTPSSLSLAS